MNPQNPPPPATPSPSSSPDRHGFMDDSILLKTGMILLLTLLLLIPLAMIRSVLHERVSRRDAAVEEIGKTWGSRQRIVGPLLVIPYRTQAKVWKDQMIEGRSKKIEVEEEVLRRAYFLPETLRVDGSANPQRLYRGIYAAIVFSSQIRLEGVFPQPDFSPWKINPGDILWEDALISLAISDLRGARESLHIEIDGQSRPLVPGCMLPGYSSGLYGEIHDLAADSGGFGFSVALNLNGSEGVRIAPFGMSTEANWQSEWPDPSFQGAFLPSERRVGTDGFSAEWKISYYGRGYPQQWTKGPHDEIPDRSRIEASLFGIDFLQVVDGYRLAERSMKYGILFFVLIFTAFFLFEILMNMRIHPFQYTLVGAAMCLFYLVVLALSEFMAFGGAYLLGAVIAVLTISLYSASVLRGGRRALIIAAWMALVYALLYFILRLQDYALLVGASGLFASLAIVMYATRNVDWYAREPRREVVKKQGTRNPV